MAPERIFFFWRQLIWKINWMWTTPFLSRDADHSLSTWTWCVIRPLCLEHVSNYKSFQRFQYKLHMNVYRHVLEYRFTYFALYVVHIKFLKRFIFRYVWSKKYIRRTQCLIDKWVMSRKSAKQKTAGCDHFNKNGLWNVPTLSWKGSKLQSKENDILEHRRSHAWHVARAVWTWPNAVDIASYLIDKPLSGQPVRGLKHVSSLECQIGEGQHIIQSTVEKP